VWADKRKETIQKNRWQINCNRTVIAKIKGFKNRFAPGIYRSANSKYPINLFSS
jgi:hypothetical protein